MAVEIQKFKDATTPLKDRILRAMQASLTQALDIYDIIGAVEGQDRKMVVMMMLLGQELSGQKKQLPGEFKGYLAALEELVKEGKIVSAQIAGETVYATKEALEKIK